MSQSRVLFSSLGVIALSSLAAAVVACGSSSPRATFGDDTDGGPSPSSTSTSPSPTSTFGSDGGTVTTPTSVSAVYGHSDTTLFELNPTTNVVTTVGDFDGCSSVIDIALDSTSTLYAVSFTELYTVDKTTAKCTTIASGSYPNSLSFVPKGTVDSAAEALVGYNDSTYVRIDTTTGAISTIGSLGSGYVSSGDIVSVIGGSTYLTVKGSGNTKDCTDNDCLVEVNPTTGALVKNWGDIGHKDVFGLSFWAGKVYGFDNGGDLFAVTFGSSTITTTTITMPSAPPDLSFWGAGSTTSAPLIPTN